MAEKEKKADSKEEKKDVKKDAKKEVKKAEKVEKVETTEEKVENVEAKVEIEKKYSKINIIAIAVIVVLLIILSFFIFKKPSPKDVAKDFLYLSQRNPVQAMVKYGQTELQEALQQQRTKYIKTTIKEVIEMDKKGEVERVKVKYTLKQPNFYEVEKEVRDILTNRKIEQGTKKYNKAYIKEYTRILKKKKDSLQESEQELILKRQPGEKRWVIDLGI